MLGVRSPKGPGSNALACLLPSRAPRNPTGIAAGTVSPERADRRHGLVRGKQVGSPVPKGPGSNALACLLPSRASQKPHRLDLWVGRIAPAHGVKTLLGHRSWGRCHPSGRTGGTGWLGENKLGVRSPKGPGSNALACLLPSRRPETPQYAPKGTIVQRAGLDLWVGRIAPAHGVKTLLGHRSGDGVTRAGGQAARAGLDLWVGRDSPSPWCEDLLGHRSGDGVTRAGGQAARAGLDLWVGRIAPAHGVKTLLGHRSGDGVTRAGGQAARAGLDLWVGRDSPSPWCEDPLRASQLGRCHPSGRTGGTGWLGENKLGVRPRRGRAPMHWPACSHPGRPETPQYAPKGHIVQRAGLDLWVGRIAPAHGVKTLLGHRSGDGVTRAGGQAARAGLDLWVGRIAPAHGVKTLLGHRSGDGVTRAGGQAARAGLDLWVGRDSPSPWCEDPLRASQLGRCHPSGRTGGTGWLGENVGSPVPRGRLQCTGLPAPIPGAQKPHSTPQRGTPSKGPGIAAGTVSPERADRRHGLVRGKQVGSPVPGGGRAPMHWPACSHPGAQKPHRLDLWVGRIAPAHGVKTLLGHRSGDGVTRAGGQAARAGLDLWVGRIAPAHGVKTLLGHRSWDGVTRAGGQAARAGLDLWVGRIAPAHGVKTLLGHRSGDGVTRAGGQAARAGLDLWVGRIAPAHGVKTLLGHRSGDGVTRAGGQAARGIAAGTVSPERADRRHGLVRGKQVGSPSPKGPGSNALACLLPSRAPRNPTGIAAGTVSPERADRRHGLVRGNVGSPVPAGPGSNALACLLPSRAPRNPTGIAAGTVSPERADRRHGLVRGKCWESGPGGAGSNALACLLPSRAPRNPTVRPKGHTVQRAGLDLWVGRIAPAHGVKTLLGHRSGDGVTRAGGQAARAGLGFMGGQDSPSPWCEDPLRASQRGTVSPERADRRHGLVRGKQVGSPVPEGAGLQCTGLPAPIPGVPETPQYAPKGHNRPKGR
ncbi:collagen alpha-1(I) chain-like [Oreochromis aureus]|uniref:collagen alpha-1(I) chain-like n=1 Tax=Oreochromis aureus TaxID=47969 RepID=UPI0019533593|nr:collagen alpha-1(I) chain-like [Oreochromis aureus]